MIDALLLSILYGGMIELRVMLGNVVLVLLGRLPGVGRKSCADDERKMVKSLILQSSSRTKSRPLPSNALAQNASLACNLLKST